MNHEFYFEVRGYELDSFNHVNNARYLNYLEAARWKFFHDTQWINYMQELGLHAVVVETNIRYLREMKIFDKGVVKTRWSYDGEYLIASQNVYFDQTKDKVVKAIVKMILVSTERIVHEIPQFVKIALDKGSV